MKPYGIKRFWHCCPGHDRHPTGSYSNRRSKKARTRGKTISAKRERTHVRIDLAKLTMTEQLPTGIDELDEMLSGTERHEMHIFVGAPAKRTVPWDQLMNSMAERNGEKTLVGLALEMDDPPDKQITP